MSKKPHFSKSSQRTHPSRTAGRKPNPQSSFSRSSGNSSPRNQSHADEPSPAVDARKIDFKNTRVVVGTHAVLEAVKSNSARIKSVWLQKGFESSEDLRELEQKCRQSKVSMEVRSKEQLTKEFPNHQGAVVVVDGRPRLDWNVLAEKKESMVLFLDGIEDPHNLGAILRTAWLMGVDALFIPQDRSVHLTATVHKVACGGVEHVPVEIVPGFQSSIDKLKEQGYWVFGLSHKASKVLYNFKLPEKIIWMIGAEDKGLRTTTEKLCDEMAKLPQISAEASYNASVATALALGETSRQHGTLRT